MTDDENFMLKALKLAETAAELGEVPVGAVIVNPEGQIIGEGYNQRETEKTATAHAEIRAIEAACKKIGAWRLENCKLYVTLEPCLMCSGAIINARLKTIIFGALDPKAGAVLSLYNTLNDSRLNHRCQVVTGIREGECSQLLSDFFKKLRETKRLATNKS